MNALRKRENFFLFLLVASYFILFSGLSILRHQSLNSSYLDLGLESQAVWNTSQGRFFETSFGSSGQVVSALSYHTTPIIILVAPLYRIFADPITLLILQSLILSLGAIAVFLISQAVLNKNILSFAFVVSYLIYPPLQYSNLSDFHYVTFATTFLLFAFYFLMKKRWFLFYLFLVLSVSTKENIALVAALIGIYTFLVLKERLRGLIIFILSIIYFLVVIYLIFPKLGGGMGAFGRYDYLGRDTIAVAINLITHPINTLVIVFMLPKIIYLLHIFASVGFLPILSPATLLLSASELLFNLLSSYNPQWQVKFHYTAAITPFVFISAIYGASRALYFLEKRGIKHSLSITSLYLVCISLIWNVIHSPSPINYKFDSNKFTVSTETQSALKSLSLIVDSGSVSAMNNLGAHLTNRRALFRFPINYLNADYVAVDPWALTYFDLSQVTPAQYSPLISDLLRSGKFEMIVSQPRLLLFKKKL